MTSSITKPSPTIDGLTPLHVTREYYDASPNTSPTKQLPSPKQFQDMRGNMIRVINSLEVRTIAAAVDV